MVVFIAIEISEKNIIVYSFFWQYTFFVYMALQF